MRSSKRGTGRESKGDVGSKGSSGTSGNQSTGTVEQIWGTPNRYY